MNRLIIKALKGVFISCFMLILLISLVQAVEHPPPKNSSVLSYGITFFSITPDFKSDISIHLSILPFDKHFADKARSVEHPPPKNSSVLSYGITFFSITPDFKSDISIHLSILPFDKHFADKARF